MPKRPEALVPIPLEWLSGRLGRPVHIMVRQLATHEFFDGFPDAMPGMECYAGFTEDRKRRAVSEAEAWADRIILASLAKPSPTALVRQIILGPERSAIIRAIFERWGFLWREDGTYAGLPTANMRSILRHMAKESGTPPSSYWRMPIAEFLFNYHVLYGDVGRRKTRSHPMFRGRRLAMNDPMETVEVPPPPELVQAMHG